MEHPIPEEPRPHRSDRAIEDTKEGHRLTGARLDEFEVRLSGGIERKKLARAVGSEPEEMRGVSSHLPGEIVQKRSRRANRRRQVRTPEAIERMNLEMLAQELRCRQSLEDVSVEEVGVCKTVEKLPLRFRRDRFGRQDAREFIDQKRHARHLCETKLSGRQFAVSQTNRAVALAHGGKIIRTAIVEAKVVKCAGAQDLTDFATDEFPGLHFANLVANRRAPTGSNELFDVASRRMIWHAAHGDFPAPGQRHVENRRCLPRIVPEHLIEIPQTEKKQRMRRQLTPNGVVLLHHRCQRIAPHGNLSALRFSPSAVFQGLHASKAHRNEKPCQCHRLGWREGSPASDDCLRNATRGLVASA